MSKTTFTPGLWHIREGGNTYHTLHVDADEGSKKICLLNARLEAAANAALIAAAPDLLAALKECKEHMLSLFLELNRVRGVHLPIQKRLTDDCFNKADAALRKATQ